MEDFPWLGYTICCNAMASGRGAIGCISRPISLRKRTLDLTSLLHDTFVRIDQTWVCDRSGQEGSMLVGCDSDTGRVSLHWIDTFHEGRSVMICPGLVFAMSRPASWPL